MHVNYDVWGAPETWTDVVANMEGKQGASNRRTFRDLWVNNYLPLNSIDLPYFWGIGKGSILNQGHYIAPYGEIDGENEVSYIETDAFAQRDRPLCLRGNSASTGASQTLNRYEYRYSPYLTTAVTSVQSAYIDYLILSFNYQKIVLIPYVEYCSRSDIAPNSTVTGKPTTTNTPLKQFIDEEKYLGNVILRITYKYALSAAGSRTLASAVHVSPTINYNIDSKDWQYNNVPFYARSGISIINGSYSNNRSYCVLASQSDYQNVTPVSSITELNAMAFHYCKGTTTTCNVYYYDDTKSFWKIHTSNAYTWCAFPYIDMTAENVNDVRDYILSQFAYIGLLFVYDPDDYNKAVGDTGLYVPVFDANGITTGEYKDGDAALALENATWNVPDTNYDPDRPPEADDDIGDLYNTGSRRFFYNSLNVHLMSVSNYYQFIQKLNALNMTDPDNETWQLQFKGLNPTDYIVGAYVSFVKPPKGNSSTIMLGPVDMNQSEYTYAESNDNAGFFTFGTKPINAFYHDFRDYEPYTKIEVYLPLCGSIELETAYFMEASLKIDYYYDIYTMSCTACLYRVKENEELLYKTINGSIGAQIPMLSANMGAYQNQIKSIENAMKQNNLKLMTSTAALAAGVIAAPMTSGTSLIAAGTAALSGTAGIASSLQKQAELDYQIEHLQPSVSVTGAADPQLALCEGQLMPKLIIKRPKMTNNYDQTVYAQTIGNACCINDILGYINGDTETLRHGLVVCSSVDTSGIVQIIGESDYISPTADEINMIKQALSSGVIL